MSKMIIRRCMATAQITTKPARTLRAQVSFLAHASPLLDLYVSFARQAAQAMTITVSKTLYPIRNTPDRAFLEKEFPESSDQESAFENGDGKGYSVYTEGISYDYDRVIVNRSPFVHGKHQDQFEVRTYRRNLDLFDCHEETAKRWLHYVTMNMPAGLGLEYKLHEHVDLQAAFKKEQKQESLNDTNRAE